MWVRGEAFNGCIISLGGGGGSIYVPISTEGSGMPTTRPKTGYPESIPVYESVGTFLIPTSALREVQRSSNISIISVNCTYQTANAAFI